MNSGNGKSFFAASKWLGSFMRDERMQDYLEKNSISPEPSASVGRSIQEDGGTCKVEVYWGSESRIE